MSADDGGHASSARSRSRTAPCSSAARPARGKTTTLYAALDRAERRRAVDRHDRGPGRVPAAGRHADPGAHEDRADVRARRCARSSAQDPDVILVGEIRDDETAQIAIQAAMTGHLVLSTLHTNDAAGAIARMRTLGVDPDLLAGSINCIVSQRLARRICTHCREAYEPSRRAGDRDEPHLGRRERRRCTARSAVSSARTRATPGPSRALRAHAGARARPGAARRLDDEVFEAAVAAGMRTLREDGVRLSLAGVTTLEEVRRITGDRRLGLSPRRAAAVRRDGAARRRRRPGRVRTRPRASTRRRG